MKRLLWLVLACVPAVAQPRVSMVPWWDMPVVRDLNLTADQEKQIRATVSEYRTRLIDLRAAAEKADGDLEDAYGEEKFDPGRANDAANRLVNARTDLTRTLCQMSIKLRTILTTEQWRELGRRLPRRGWDRPGMRGPGGPGRGPRPNSTTPAPEPPARP